MAFDLVKTQVAEAGELDLTHRPEPINSHTHGHAEDARLGKRRIQGPIFSEFIDQPLRHTKNAPVFAYILS